MNTDLGSATTALRLGLALLLGGVIGIEREVHGKNAGLRTHMLVALGSALFTLVSLQFPRVMGAAVADPARIAAQVLTGVGFLGAGTIIQARGSVHGLTTAASIWLVAAIGLAVAGGFYVGGILATVLGEIVLVVFWRMERNMLQRKGSSRMVIAELEGEEEAFWAERFLLDANLPASRWQVVRRKDGAKVRVEGLPRQEDVERLLAILRERGSATEIQVEKGR